MKNLLIAVAILLTAVQSAQAGLFGRDKLKVPATELTSLDDSCRSWMMVFTADQPDADGAFLLNSVRAYGLGNGVRLKHITPSMPVAWNDWSVWHGSRNTIMTLSPDGKRVLSIAQSGGGAVNGIAVPAIPQQVAGQSESKRQFELAKLIVLEDPDGKHGRLLDTTKEPFWLPFRREVWNRPCNVPNTPPKPNVDVAVVQPPQMDPSLLAELNHKDEYEENKKNYLPVAIILGALCAIPLGYAFSRIGS